MGMNWIMRTECWYTPGTGMFVGYMVQIIFSMQNTIKCMEGGKRREGISKRKIIDNLIFCRYWCMG